MLFAKMALLAWLMTFLPFKGFYPVTHKQKPPTPPTHKPILSGHSLTLFTHRLPVVPLPSIVRSLRRSSAFNRRSSFNVIALRKIWVCRLGLSLLCSALHSHYMQNGKLVYYRCFVIMMYMHKNTGVLR